MADPIQPCRRTLLTSTLGAAFLASCGSEPRTDAPRPASTTPPAQGATPTPTQQDRAVASTAAIDVPHGGSFPNGSAAGGGVLEYDTTAHRDWSDIDRWYRSKGMQRHEWNGEPRGHRIVAGARGAGAAVDQDSVLASGMMLENDTDIDTGVVVIAHHNVTRIRGGAVQLGDSLFDEPLMGIHAPEVPGDVFTWYLPVPEGTAEFRFLATSVEVIPDADGEYAKLFTPRTDGTPQLVTYQCHPCGSLRQRRVVRHKLTHSTITNAPVTYVQT